MYMHAYYLIDCQNSFDDYHFNFSDAERIQNETTFKI
jgi:hypothetical protein